MVLFGWPSHFFNFVLLEPDLIAKHDGDALGESETDVR